MAELPRGRGAGHNPANRFIPLYYEDDPARIDPDGPAPRTKFYHDHTRSIIATNDSPDVGFTHSINPYRGCEHGCSYCYARPFHEYLGLSSGLDFETKIMVKADAPQLLRKELMAKSWKSVSISISGVTDAYQPIERRLKVTRGCLEVLAEFRNPFGIVTKNHLVTRDIDLLAPMAAINAAAVFLSVTTLDPELARVMEPRASAPEARLRAIRELTAAGVRVGVMVAPIIPGLNDHEIPAILAAVKEAGARTAAYVMLRLPFAIKDLFSEWLEHHFPERKAKVLGRLRELRDGRLYDSRFGSRMRGDGPIADMVRDVFHLHRARLGLDERGPELATECFRRPGPMQRLMFE
jgi:DNA repair photolyase